MRYFGELINLFLKGRLELNVLPWLDASVLWKQQCLRRLVLGRFEIFFFFSVNQAHFMFSFFFFSPLFASPVLVIQMDLSQVVGIFLSFFVSYL